MSKPKPIRDVVCPACMGVPYTKDELGNLCDEHRGLIADKDDDRTFIRDVI